MLLKQSEEHAKSQDIAQGDTDSTDTARKHLHFQEQYHKGIEQKQKEVNFVDFWDSMDIQQPRTVYNPKTFWDDIRSGEIDTHNFQTKLVEKQHKTPASTQSWKIPPGILSSLNSRNWATFGGANFKEEYFPLDYESNKDRTNFLDRTNIKSKTILNPPYKDSTIEAFLTHIVHISETNNKHFFVILPLRKEKPWFTKFIVNSLHAKLIFRNKIAFLRGIDEAFHGIANEQHFIWTVGIHGPTILLDNSPLGDFHIQWKYFARFNFLYNIHGSPPIGKLTRWRKEITKSLLKKSKIRTDHFQKRSLHAKKLYTPWKQGIKTGANILEDHIRSRTPKEWTTRLQKQNKRLPTHKINSKKATKLFDKLGKRDKRSRLCEICLSGKHSTKFCTQYMATAEDIINEQDLQLFSFFKKLPTENGRNTILILRQSDLPGEEIIRKFQHHRYKGGQLDKLQFALKTAHARAKQCSRVLDNLKLQWNIPSNLTFSHIRYHIAYWYGHGFTKKHILRMIKGYRIRPDMDLQQRIQVYHKKEPNQKEKDKHFSTIRKRLLSGKIIPVNENIPVVIHPEFLVEQNGKIRPVMDCSAMNGLYQAESVRFPTTNTAIKIAKQSWVAAVDLESAYNQCPIFPLDLQYFAIKSENSYFIPTGLPQGYSRAPEIFTRFLDPVVDYLIDLGILTTKLLDDLLFVLGDATKEEKYLQQILDAIRQIIADLGLRTNDKSQESAYSEIIYLGKLINTATGQAFITPEKLQKTIDQCIQLLTAEKVTVKRIAQAVGLANFLKVSAPRKFRHIFRRISEQTKSSLPQRPTKKDWERLYDTKIDLTIQAKMEIIFWLDTLQDLVEVQTKSVDRTQVILYADTSETHTGIYVHIEDKDWEELTLPLPYSFNNLLNEANSTAREIIGIKRGLDHILSQTTENLHIRVYCDNEASSYQHKSMKATDTKSRAALTDIHLLEKQYDIQITWIWHRRTVKAARFTDYLSKEKYLIPKEAIRKLMDTKFNNKLEHIVDNKQFLEQLWRYTFMKEKTRKKFTQHTLIFIHPDIFLDQRWEILDWISEIDYRGAILMPALTANPLRNMTRHHEYERIRIPRNKLKKYFTISPSFSERNKQRPFLLFQRTRTNCT